MRLAMIGEVGMTALKIHLLVSSLLSLVIAGSCLAQEKPTPDDALITLERTVCYGPCPIYKLTIIADGTVTFEGRQNGKVKGLVKSRINRDDLRNLMAVVEAASYFSLNNSYEIENDGVHAV